MVSGRQGYAVQITTQTNVWFSEDKFMKQLLDMYQHAGSPEWAFNHVIGAFQRGSTFAKASERMQIFSQSVPLSSPGSSKPTATASVAIIIIKETAVCAYTVPRPSTFHKPNR